ncbi:hypothetical protein [Micromonospora sp. NPDC050200]|uniref:hypothetical protein n=1 Tax=Micromonospora sp. NPDC050200 TaxID=3155664 RepID=UPI00340E9217
MSTTTFVNLPVRDLPAGVEFFTALGFTGGAAAPSRWNRSRSLCCTISAHQRS